MFLQEMSEVTTIPEALVNTGLGMGTVFVVLILISFIIYLFKFIPMLLGVGKAKQNKAPSASAGTAKAAPSAKESRAPEKGQGGLSDNSQLVAVITAAIAAQMEEETGVPVAADGLYIRSIKKRVFSL